jgi:hypothetical protein
MRQGAVACGLLLELPSREFEDAFWQDDVTIRCLLGCATELLTACWLAVVPAAVVSLSVGAP